MKENGFKLAKEKRRRYPTQTITDANYADDIALLANTPDQAESRLHSLKRAAGDICLHINADKREYIYLGSNVSSTEKDIDTRLANAWTAIDRYRSYGSQT